MALPTDPWPAFASTWLLLRMKKSPPRSTRHPNVPEQQMTFPPVEVRSVTLPPLVPNRMGNAWATAVSLGYSTVTVEEPETDGSAWDAAVTVTGSGLGMDVAM